MSISIKLQENNLKVCEKYKTERKAQRLDRVPQAHSNLRAKRAAREEHDENVPAKRVDL